MATTYTPCDEELDGEMGRRVAALLGEHYPEVVAAGVTVGTLFARNPEDCPVKNGGYPALAVIKVNSYRDRVEGKPDCTITIDGNSDGWPAWSERKRTALLHHELHHLELQWQETEFGRELKRDDLGRPKLKLKLHDFQLGFFDAIAERYGDDAVELESLKGFLAKRSHLFGKS